LTQLTPVLGIVLRATGQSEGTSLVDRSTTTAKPVNRFVRKVVRGLHSGVSVATVVVTSA
jgi:hypothetical protein